MKFVSVAKAVALTGLFAVSIWGGEALAMDRVTISDENYAALFGGAPMEEAKNDPELANTMKRFVYGEIAAASNLDTKHKQLVTIVVLATTQN